MGLLDTFRRWFGPPADEDPREPVEIGLVPIGLGPLAVSRLRDEGYDAAGFEAFNIVTSVSSGYRILVPSAEAEAATALLEQIITD